MRQSEKDFQKVAEDTAQPGPEVVIKKYANRRLYNTATSSYVTLDDLARMVKEGVNFKVFDAKTGEEITRAVLTQIIFEEEGKGQNLLPINFLRQLIRFYGHSMGAFVPSYLEFSLDTLAREQDKLRKQFMGSLGAAPFRAVEEQTKHNMALFQQAMQMFTPFAGRQPQPDEDSAPAREAEPAPESPATSEDDLEALRDQLAAVQRQLDRLAKKKNKG